MLVEIEQHQAAGKQAAQNRSPAVGGGEKPALVKQDQFVGLGSQHGDAGLAEHAAAVDESVLRRHPLDLALWVSQYLERPADHGPAFVTWNMRQRMTVGRHQRRAWE